MYNMKKGRHIVAMSRSQDPIVLPSFLDTNSCVGLILMGSGGFELDFCPALLFIESAALLRGFDGLMAAGVAVLRDTLRCSVAVHVCPSAVFIFDNLYPFKSFCVTNYVLLKCVFFRL
mmetsp:Transcript_15707/g.23768  ORF Transcript_15707/g.23768 Transcript_15707/m.23768 type:complete len:118 (+) Transcript_15707:404-757(+)